MVVGPRLPWGALLGALIVASTAGCPSYIVEKPPPKCPLSSDGCSPSTRPYPYLFAATADILFVIDRSASMRPAQRRLVAALPRLLEPLRSDGVAGLAVDLHIGVVSSDLGTGRFVSIPSCSTVGGDKGAMQSRQIRAGCKGPSDRFIALAGGKTNIPGCSGDPYDCVASAFSCIAELGTDGCRFSAPLEAARAALDPKLDRNPGFLRDDALLALVLLTDDIDCSARSKRLFDDSETAREALGPLTSFRCFELGVQCEGAAKRTEPGPRSGCRSAGAYLYEVDQYVDFFTKLVHGDRQRVEVLAIAGPASPVRITTDSEPQPALAASCRTSAGFAAPAIRIGELVEAFDGELAPICAGDLGPPLARLGRKLVSRAIARCMPGPLLTDSGGIACREGLALGDGERCTHSCLDQVDCTIRQRSHHGAKTEVEQCPARLFDDPTVDACGSSCPCWRLVPRPHQCDPQTLGTAPYGLEILRDGDPPPDTAITAACRSSTLRWGSDKLASLPQCDAS